MFKMVNKVFLEIWLKVEDELFISCKYDCEFFDW